MHLCIEPKIVMRVSTVLVLSTSLVCASVSRGRYGVSAGSGIDRVAFTFDSKNRDGQYTDPIATAPGTGITLKSRHANQDREQTIDERPLSPGLALLRVGSNSGHP